MLIMPTDNRKTYKTQYLRSFNYLSFSFKPNPPQRQQHFYFCEVLRDKIHGGWNTDISVLPLSYHFLVITSHAVYETLQHHFNDSFIHAYPNVPTMWRALDPSYKDDRKMTQDMVSTLKSSQLRRGGRRVTTNCKSSCPRERHNLRAWVQILTPWLWAVPPGWNTRTLASPCLCFICKMGNHSSASFIGRSRTVWHKVHKVLCRCLALSANVVYRPAPQG